MIVREETPADIPAIFAVNRLAFGRAGEAELVDQLRAAGKAALSLVAEDEGEVIGHILFSPARIETPAGPVAVVGLGPLAVLPGRQRQGVGSALAREGLARLRQAGARLCIVEGSPAYYPRFGFRDAAPLGITCQFDPPPGCFMVQELQPGALAGLSGRAFYADEFLAVG
jgi:putative acetyltransferase